MMYKRSLVQLLGGGGSSETRRYSSRGLLPDPTPNQWDVIEIALYDDGDEKVTNETVTTQRKVAVVRPRRYVRQKHPAQLLLTPQY